MKCATLKSLQAVTAMAVCLALGTKQGQCGPVFYSTTDASDWQVAVNIGGTDGSFSSFPPQVSLRPQQSRGGLQERRGGSPTIRPEPTCPETGPSSCSARHST